MNYDSKFCDAGKIIDLWAKSDLHKSWSIESFRKYVLPPLASGQYVLLQSQQGLPLAYVSWAFFSVEVEAKYLDDPSAISFSDWVSGDRIWLIDFVSPFGKDNYEKIANLLRNEIFPGKVARSLSVRRGRDRSKIVKWIGKDVTRKDAAEIFDFYHQTVKKLCRSERIVWSR